MFWGNTRLVMAILPFSEKISTDDWSTKMSIVAVLPVTMSGAYIDVMEKVPLKLVFPVAEVR